MAVGDTTLLRQQLNLQGTKWYDYKGVDMRPLYIDDFDTEYQELQKARIKILLGKKQAMVDQMNNFLNKFKKDTAKEKHMGDDMFQHLVSTVDSIMTKNYVPNTVSTHEYNEWYEEINRTIKGINEIIDSVNPDGKISLPDDKFFKLMKKKNKSDKDIDTIKKIRFEYIEEVAQKALQAAGFDSYNSSRWTSSDLEEKISGGQLPQDAVGFVLKDLNGTVKNDGVLQIRFKVDKNSLKKIKDLSLNQKKEKIKKELEEKGGIEVSKINKNKEFYIASIKPINVQEFLASINIEKNTKFIKNGTVSFKLDSEIYDLMAKAALNIQAKSGTKQHLFNDETERNKISLIKYDENLKLLKNFYDQFKVGESSEILSQYANYVMSKNFNEFFIIKQNEFYLTDRGFATMDEIMDNNKFYYRLSPLGNLLSHISADEYKLVEGKINLTK